MQPHRHRVLIIPRTYPGRVHPLKGVFVQKQVEAQAAVDDVAVLNVISDPNLSRCRYDCQVETTACHSVVRVYYQKNDLRFAPTAPLIKMWRYIKASRIGFRRIIQLVGMPDLVHVHMVLPGGFLAYWLKWRYHIPYLITEHLTNYLPADGHYQRASFFYRQITRWLCRNSNAMVAVSPSLLHALQGHGLVQGHGRVIGNVIDLTVEPFKKKPADRPFTFLTACLLDDDQKNISGLLRSFAQLLKIKPTDRLLIAGDGPDREKLQSLVKEWALENQVTFTGLIAHAQMRQLWQQSDCYVLSSRYETFSVAAAEAMLYGLPAIVTACGGPEHFVTAESGQVIPPGDEAALTAAMLQCQEHERSFNPQQMRLSIQERFSAKTIGQQYHDLYAALMTSWPVGFCGQRLFLQPDWLVLDVGSGHNPNRRANILLERELSASVHRSGARALIPGGKQLVVGDAQAMPFKSQALDFIVASHIAEHIPQPARFLQELHRVGKRGYIETPGPLSERLLTEPYHLWVIQRKRSGLVFMAKKHPKPAWPFFYRWYYLNEERYGHSTHRTTHPLLIISKAVLALLWKRTPGAYTRLHWQGKIDFTVKNQTRKSA